MKNLKFLMLSAFVGLTVSCTNETLTEEVQDGAIQTRSVIDPVNIQTVSELMSSVELNQTILDEVKAGVDRSLKYGLGEAHRFSEILNPAESKLAHDLKDAALSEQLHLAFDDNDNWKSVASEDFFSILANSSIEITWPFVNKWDGKTIPFIAFTSEDENVLYKPKSNQDGTYSIDTLYLINDDYLKENPVWLITESSLSNEEVPDLKNDQFINKDGMFIHSKYAMNKLNGRINSRAKEPGVYLSTMRTTEIFESGWLGKNGEFHFFWQKAEGGKPNYATMYKRISKDEINDELQLDYKIRGTWNTDEVTNGLLILEKDGGRDRVGRRTVIYNNGTGNKNLTVEFPYESNDEVFFDQSFYQKSICGDDNYATDGTLKKYYGQSNFWIRIAVIK